MSSSAGDAFSTLLDEVAGCGVCDQMAYSHILGASNGPLDARLLIVGEAPGRLGAARTGVPFQGDRSGERLEGLLQAATQRSEEAATATRMMKREINELADAARRHQARRLVADEPDRIAAYTLETDVLQNLQRIYYYTRRMARTVLKSARATED